MITVYHQSLICKTFWIFISFLAPKTFCKVYFGISLSLPLPSSHLLNIENFEFLHCKLYKASIVFLKPLMFFLSQTWLDYQSYALTRGLPCAIQRRRWSTCESSPWTLRSFFFFILEKNADVNATSQVLDSAGLSSFRVFMNSQEKSLI